MAGSRRPLLAFAASAPLLLSAAPAASQFQQYTEPGTSILESPTPNRERFEASVEASRWRLGALYLDPWIGLRDISYNNNILAVGETGESDVTGTFGAGLRVYVPVGEDVFFNLYVLPEYVWWSSNSERNRLNGRYGAGIYTFFTRLAFAVDASLSEQQQYFSPEIEQLTHSRGEAISFSFDLQLVRSFYFFGSALLREYENLADEETGGETFRLLDRQELIYRAGFRLRPLDRVDIGIGVETSEADFVTGARNLDNRGDAPVFELAYRGPNFDASADIAYRSLDPEPGSEFLGFSGITGELAIGLLPERQLLPTFYGSRNVVYSVVDSLSHAVSDRVGFRFDTKFGRGPRLNLFAEVGRDDYRPVPGLNLDREDDVVSYGGDFDIPLGRRLGPITPGIQLRVGGRISEYDSNLPEFDRKINTITLMFNVGIAVGSGEVGAVGWP